MNAKKPWLPLAILAAALVVWAGVFAAGTYLNVSADQPRHDIRKPIIIMSGMGIFLLLWGLALWNRSRR